VFGEICGWTEGRTDRYDKATNDFSLSECA